MKKLSNNKNYIYDINSNHNINKLNIEDNDYLKSSAQKLVFYSYSLALALVLIISKIYNYNI